MLELNGVSKCYGRGVQAVQALHDINLKAPAGSFLAIQGQSGSGKSSLLNLCALLDQPDSGVYRLAGESMQHLSAQQRCRWRRDHIGMVFQHHQLIATMTVQENVAYPLVLQGVGGRQRRQRVAAMLDAVGLADRRRHLPRQLSGGERQRVGIARALIKRPMLMVADEPSASLDQANALKCLALMRTLNADTKAVVLIASHDPALMQCCDRVVQLKAGCLSET